MGNVVVVCGGTTSTSKVACGVKSGGNKRRREARVAQRNEQHALTKENLVENDAKSRQNRPEIRINSSSAGSGGGRGGNSGSGRRKLPRGAEWSKVGRAKEEVT